MELLPVKIIGGGQKFSVFLGSLIYLIFGFKTYGISNSNIRDSNSIEDNSVRCKKNVGNRLNASKFEIFDIII